MSQLQWYDYLRMVTIFLTFLASFISITEAKRNWWRYNTRDRDYWWGFNALLWFLIGAEVNFIRTDAGWSGATFLALFISIVCLRAMRRGLPPRPPFQPEGDDS